MAAHRRAGADDGRGRRRRRHVEPDDLPEGDVGGRLVRRPAAPGAGRGGRPEGDLPQLGLRRHRRGVRPDALRLGRESGPEGLCLARGRPETRPRHGRDDRGGAALPRHGRPAQPLRQDPGDEGGLAGDRGDDRPRQEHQRHADLLAAALRGSRRGVHPRARAARRKRRRSDSGDVGGELLRLTRRHRGRQAARRDRRPRPPQGAARDCEREARVRALQGDLPR